MSHDDLMRSYIVARIAKGDPTVTAVVESMTHDQLVGAVCNDSGLTYDAWCAEYILPESESARVKRLDPQIAMRALLRDWFGKDYRLTPYETLIHVRFTESGCIVSVRRDNVRAGRIREVVTSSDLIMRSYDLTRREMKDDRITVADHDFAPFHYAGQYAKITSLDDYLESVDQYLTCYRPGWSVRDPRDGWRGRPEDVDNDLWRQVWELQDQRDSEGV